MKNFYATRDPEGTSGYFKIIPVRHFLLLLAIYSLFSPHHFSDTEGGALKEVQCGLEGDDSGRRGNPCSDLFNLASDCQRIARHSKKAGAALTAKFRQIEASPSRSENHDIP